MTFLRQLLTLSALLASVYSLSAQAQTFGRPDPCAGTGGAGSSSYGACQLQRQVLERGVGRAPNLAAINESDRLKVERTCASDLARGDDLYAACVRRTLTSERADPNLPVRPLPETQQKPVTP